MKKPAAKKLAAILTILFITILIVYGTWQLFLGNLEAAFATFPFLLVIYVFLKPLRNLGNQATKPRH